jgi:hypothetical protein
MLKSAASLSDSGVLHEPPPPKPEEIRRQLQLVLSSPSFHGSKRCQQFLEYVCDRWLAGEGGTLKERTLAIEVFGRQPHSDLGEDTIVRVGAREVRKRLAQYYVTPEGAGAEIRIDLPSGSYAPDFRYVTAPAEEPRAAVPPPIELRVAPWRRRSWQLAAVLGIFAVATILAILKVSAATPSAEAFQKFWDPVLRSSDPLLIAVAHPLVYHPSSRALRMSEGNQPPQDVQVQRPLQVNPKQLDGTDLVPVFNQYVGFGDMIAANEVTSMLGRRSKSTRIRLASTVEFADFRKAQTLLIGAVTNRWTMQLQQGWRFRFSWAPDTRTRIVDTHETAGATLTHWTISGKDDGSAPEDYILVCRIRNSFAGGFILAGAGLKQFGTEAAGRLLADPDQLGGILRKLPAGWEAKNLQIVLHSKVINNTAAQPEVVASYVW